MDGLMSSEIEIKKGYPAPLGSSQMEQGINFALFSQHAEAVTLCLFAKDGKHPFKEIPLDPSIHRTGWIWHILLKNLGTTQINYGFKISGPKDPPHVYDGKKIVSDPYARGLSSSNMWAHKRINEEERPLLGKVIVDAEFDWQNDRPPHIPLDEVVVYEMHVRAFTEHPSSKVKCPGTFLGIIEKIPHLKSLGVNAIELMPIFEFDECELHRVNPKTNEPLYNVWGYSTINFFAPMNRFASSSEWTAAMDEFRMMVREMHKAGIEVYLDVVYNHTAEGNHIGPIYSFKGIDNPVYYMLNPDHTYRDYSGTGNTFNANHPVVAQLIVDSLRYWVSEMHVDGFRFDLASCLTRAEDGTPLEHPPVIQAICNDPVLANSKMIAEAWDAGGLYQVGNFPSLGRFAEWNGRYRDTVRKFIKGTDGESGFFAQALSGSQELYGKWQNPSLSINFVTAHDGYTLRDLVSYQDKHNVENGEENRDGANQNDSWNCGAEGPTSTRKIQALRVRQMKNLHCALMLSLGVPMLLMGDEYGHTRLGNNNTYCQDNALNWFLWDELKKEKEFFRFYRLMVELRKKNGIFRRRDYLDEQEVNWHGRSPLQANWGPENRFLAYSLKEHGNDVVYIAFNAHFEPAHLTLPTPPAGKKWYRVVDTSLPSPEDFYEDPFQHPPLKATYDLADHATLIALCK